MRNSKYYRIAVAWIAENDEPEWRDPITIAEQLTVILIADTFDVNSLQVARDVASYRREHPH